MKIEKIKITDEIFDLNLKFYVLLKLLVKTKLSKKQSFNLLEQINLAKDFELSKFVLTLEAFSNTLPVKKNENFINLIDKIRLQKDIKLLNFCLKLFLIKDYLLAVAKLRESYDIDKLAKLDPLSLAYDNISVNRPYSTRVNGALLVLLFFLKLESDSADLLSENTEELIKSLSSEAISLKKEGIEPNQIFMLMFNESINQSIISDSGLNYEDRIYFVLNKIGIKEIKKGPDQKDKSTEFDFFFELEGKKIGIGAKRTLRERYKQFIKTSLMSNLDLMIQITLGLDLTEEKVKNIISHGVQIFVSDEIYKSRHYLKKFDKVHSVKDLNLATLKKLLIKVK
jgi:hypothetical protein